MAVKAENMMTQLNDTREKFYALARKAYPNVGEPGTVWVLAEVLGWEWDDIKDVCVDGFSKESYKVFRRDDNGDRVWSSPNTVKAITRKWTKQEKSLLKDWWWLLGY